LQKHSAELRASLQVLQDFIQQQSDPKLDSLQRQMDSCMEGIQSMSSYVKNTRGRDILCWLDFRQKTWRFDGVDAAHLNTLGWIYQTPTADTPWHDFGAYLSGNNIFSPYFINGKAGSGKSTLMKVIATDSRTTVELHKWAGNHELLIPHFFFWNTGSQLQRSHTGLLRALLHQALKKYHDLIPAVFPDLYSNEKLLFNGEEPAYVELKAAFERLKVRSAPFLRICILVDGIDEFDGDHRDMSEFLCSIASPTIKVIASSRPLNACLNAFKHCPTLKLQDLTRNDMDVFIRDRLNSHPVMRDLQAESPQKAHILFAELQAKAEGVFLWVRLVVGILLRGLDDGDDFDDLLPKLRALPSDLRDLYARMFAKLPNECRVQAAEMFQVFEWWRLQGFDEPLELLLFSFAIQHPHAALRLPTSPYTASEHSRFTDRMEARIRSRTCGLLEVRHIGQDKTRFWPPSPIVTFIHRSVAEFLVSEKIWDDLRALTTEARFSPGTHIAFGILSIMKTSDLLERRDGMHGSSAWTSYIYGLVEFSMDVCRRTEDTEVSFMVKYMQALDKTMIRICKDWILSSASSDSLVGQRQQRLDLQNEESHAHVKTSRAKLDIHWSANVAPSYGSAETITSSIEDILCAQASIYSLAAYHGYYRYLKAVDCEIRLVGVASLILFGLGNWIDRKAPFEARRETLRYLLYVLEATSDLGIETPVGNNTLWVHTIVVVRGVLQGKGLTGASTLGRQRTGLWVAGFESPDPMSTNYTGESWKTDVQQVGSLPSSSNHGAEIMGMFGPGINHLGQVRANRRRLIPGEALIISEHSDPLTISPTLNMGEDSPTPDLDEDWATSDSDEESVSTVGNLDHNKEARQHAAKESDAYQAAEILRLFLSVAKDSRKLITQDVKAPNLSTIRPLGLLRKVINKGREDPSGWVTRPEYEFLHELLR
jgi:hypothetical protein